MGRKRPAEMGSSGEYDHGPQDQVLVCVDCSDRFTWTAGEQLYFERKSLSKP